MREEIENFAKILGALMPFFMIYVWSIYYNLKLGILIGGIVGIVVLITSLRYLKVTWKERIVLIVVGYIILASLLYLASGQTFAVYPYTFTSASALDIVVNSLITAWIVIPTILAIIFANFFKMDKRTLFLIAMLATAGINLLLAIAFLGVVSYLDISADTFMEALTSHPLASYSGTLMIILAPIIAILVKNAFRKGE